MRYGGGNGDREDLGGECIRGERWAECWDLDLSKPMISRLRRGCGMTVEILGFWPIHYHRTPSFLELSAPAASIHG